MKAFFTLLSLFLSVISFSQISISGSSTAITIANNAPAGVVDNALTVTGSSAIDGAKASISANFSSGDVLGYTATLPSGITGSYSSTTGILSFTGNGTAAQYQAILRTVTFSTTSSVTTQRTVLFNLGTAISFSGNGHFYEFIAGSYGWTTAKANAAAKTLYGLHGYLATITSQAENDFIQQKLSADGWIGASDDYTEINAATGASTYSSQSGYIRPSEGKWYWVTGPAGEIGTQFSTGNNSPTAVSSRFMNWNSGEPNNSGTENYGEIYSTGSGSAGKWNDLGTGSSLGYVVEYGGMSTDPTVTLTSSRNITMIATDLVTSIAITPYSVQSAAVYVDNAIVFYSATSITDARVTISENFKSGDVLSVAGTLPSGITSSYNSTTGVLSFTGTATPTQWQTIFRSVKFNSTSTALNDRDITFSAGNLVAFSNGHFYEYVSTAGSWTTAKSSAAARTYLGLHGYLTTITSQDENDFIKQKLSADAWIGASDDYSQIDAATGITTYASQLTSEGKWYWVTGPAGEIGTQFSTGNSTPAAVSSRFMNWNSGEPNNVGSSENYAEIYSSGSNPGKWNDLPNTSSLGYVVEYGGLSTDPVLFLSATKTISINLPLPVTGMQFSVEKNGTTSNLRWSTQTEINTVRYDILHSAGGNNFTKVGEVAAAGNSNGLKTYQWTDKKPISGVNYYRLQQFDRDGRYTFSDVKIVVFESERILLSPNPASSSIT
ncbi:MAG: lectin-like protein, partial [Bacteroidota bacterium]